MSVKVIRIYQLDGIVNAGLELKGGFFEVEVPAGPVAGGYINKRLSCEDFVELVASQVSVQVAAPTVEQLQALLREGAGIRLTRTADGLLEIAATAVGVAVQRPPAAPGDVQVDDTADTMSGLLVPGFPAVADYEVFGAPGFPGIVNASVARGDVQNGRIYSRGLVGSIMPGGAGIRVAASGNRPAGAWMLNDKPFTGVITPTAPAATTPDAPFAAFDSATRTLSFSHALGTSELEINRQGGSFQPYAPVQVDDSSHQAGEWKARVKAYLAGNRNPSGTADSPAIAAKTVVNRIPVADAGQDVTLSAGTSSLALMGVASDPDPGDTLTYAWRQITGPNAATGLPATSLNVVASNLVAGTYQFGFRSTDNHGAQSVEDFVMATVQQQGGTPPTGGGYAAQDYFAQDYNAN